MKHVSLFLYAGIFLLSMASLNLQISLARLLSVAQWYHFAFLVVSTSLLGLGASGSFLSILPPLWREGFHKRLSLLPLFFALVVPTAYFVTNRLPFDMAKVAWDPSQLLFLLLFDILYALPFFLTGLVMGHLLSIFPHRAPTMYFSDILGAACGSLLPLLLMPRVGGEGAMMTSSVLGLVSSVAFAVSFSHLKKMITLHVLVAGGLLFLLSHQTLLSLRLSPYKALMVAMRYPDSRLLDTRWNAFSRVDVIESPAVHFAPGLSLVYQGILPPQVGLTVDGDGLTAITAFSESGEGLRFLSFLPSALPFFLRERAEALILEPQGGLDVLSALYYGARAVDAVEINPLIVEILTGRLRAFSGGIYNRPDVTVTIGDGRSFLKRSEKTYDVIETSVADILGAASTGVYSLGEDYQWTVEAFMEYYRHLKDGGLFAVTRYLLPPPRQELRLVAGAVEALRRAGIPEPGRHLAIIRTWGTVTLILKKGGFTGKEIEAIKEFCRGRRFDLVYYAGISPGEKNIYNRFPTPLYETLMAAVVEKDERDDVLRAYPFDVRAVVDERPFFYHFFRWTKITEVWALTGGKWLFFIEGGYLLPVLFLQTLILSGAFILLPLVRHTRTDAMSAREEAPPLLYFFCLGVGFIFLEVALIQKFILFLGHPAYAIATVIAALLLSAGVGARLSAGLSEKALFWILPLISVGVVLSLFLFPLLFEVLLSQGLAIRQAATFLCIFPLGLVMGMPFPTGIRITGRLSPHLIPWAWGVNGCASVLGASGAPMVALGAGFTGVFLSAAAAYLVALWAISRFLSRPSWAQRTHW